MFTRWTIIRVIQCNIRDITERKRAEERIKKGFQLESALLRIDTQILEGADTREVMGTACEAIVEMGYRMCWIGQPDPDQIVRPVAYKGFTDGYPENIDIRWDDSSGGKGPTEIAIRTGQSCVIQSIRESPIFGPWRESAIGHGYLSMAAFPLKSEEGEGIGVLNVYSDREGAFGDEEVGRLGMFAQQCSIAVMNARRIESLRDANQRLAFHVNRDAACLHRVGPGIRRRGVEPGGGADLRVEGERGDREERLRTHRSRGGAACKSNTYGRSCSKGDESSSSVNANVRKDGKIITCEWFNALLRDASGNVSGVLSMAHDVTEKAELERQLQTAQRMEAVGTLAGGIAHDFNNALTGVIGFAEMLKMKLEGNERRAVGHRPDIPRRGTRVRADAAAVDLRPPPDHRTRQPEPELRHRQSLEAGIEDRGGAYRDPDDSGEDPADHTGGRGADRTGGHEPGPERTGCHARRRSSSWSKPA